MSKLKITLDRDGISLNKNKVDFYLDGSSIVLDGGDIQKLYVNEVDDVTIVINGNVEQLSTVTGKITVYGNVNKAHSTTGDIYIEEGKVSEAKSSHGQVLNKINE